MYVIIGTKLTYDYMRRHPLMIDAIDELNIYIYIYKAQVGKWPRPSGRLPPMASHEIVAAREWIDACSAPARKREKLWEQKTSKAHVII
jgi:hypothetical protein